LEWKMKRVMFAILILLSLAAQARDPAVIREFRKANPCPETGRTVGSCPGWVVDHGIPLCAGGADKVYNLHWQNSKDAYLKDADERRLCSTMRKAGIKNTGSVDTLELGKQ
jgi:hypothetical protein